LRFSRPGQFLKKRKVEKMEMSWLEWAVLAAMAMVGFLLPIVFGKYVDARIKLGMSGVEFAVVRKAGAAMFLLAARMWRVVLGQAFVILADGRVFAMPGRKVAEAAFLGCVRGYFEFMSDRGRRGLENDEIARKLPDDGMMWRVKMGGAIVYFETIFDKGVRTALGVDSVEVQTFWTELESVRAGVVQAMRAEARRSEDGSEDGTEDGSEDGTEVGDGE
jgi:hypothetical protein